MTGGRILGCIINNESQFIIGHDDQKPKRVEHSPMAKQEEYIRKSTNNSPGKNRKQWQKRSDASVGDKLQNSAKQYNMDEITQDLSNFVDKHIVPKQPNDNFYDQKYKTNAVKLEGERGQVSRPHTSNMHILEAAREQKEFDKTTRQKITDDAHRIIEDNQDRERDVRRSRHLRTKVPRYDKADLEIRDKRQQILFDSVENSNSYASNNALANKACQDSNQSITKTDIQKTKQSDSYKEGYSGNKFMSSQIQASLEILKQVKENEKRSHARNFEPHKTEISDGNKASRLTEH